MPIAIDKPSSYFNTKLYTGNGTTNAITGVGHKPNLLWVKIRGNTYDHRLFDSVRGVSSKLFSNTTYAEVTNTTNDNLVSFDTDGFTFGASSSTNGSNENGSSFVGWSWRGSDSSAVTNTSGSITSTESANTTSGFSIVSYTGTGSNATVGHGLGVAPKMVIVKSRSNSTDWIVGNTNIGWTKLLRLNTTDAQETNNYFNDTAPTSSVFSLGTTVNVNGSGYTYVAYCFAEVKGFSKFGSYTGNGSTDGTFVYTGFKPAMIILKRTDAAGYDWRLLDNKRNTYNVVSTVLFPNTTEADLTNSANYVDFLSNGFKCNTTGAGSNASGGTYIYAAFAENPFVSSKGIPTTAR